MTGPDQENEGRTRLQGLTPGLKTPGEISSYSAFVKNLRTVLVVVALIIVTLLFYKINTQDEAQIEMSRPQKPSGQIEMTGAAYEGVDKENRPYTIMAARVVRKSEKEGMVDLESPQADMTLTDGSWISANADFGRYFQEEERLALSGIVRLFHDSGYAMETAGLEIDIKNGAATGDAAVSAQGPGGSLAATGIKIENMGERIIFSGPATMTIFEHASLRRNKG